MRATLCLLILAAVASASHLERRTSAETRSPSGDSYGSPSRTDSGNGTPTYGEFDGGYPFSEYPARDYPSAGGHPTHRCKRRHHYRYVRSHKRSGYNNGGYQPTSTTCTEDVAPATQTPVATSTCTDDILPTQAPSGSDSGVENAGEKACSAVTVTETQQVPVTQMQTVTETVDRPVTKTETVAVTSVKVEPTTIVQPVYQTETVTCVETLPPVYHTVEKTVEHTAYVTATETVYPQPTPAAVADTSEQQQYKPKPSAYPQAAAAADTSKPSAYPQAAPAADAKPSAY